MIEQSRSIPRENGSPETAVLQRLHVANDAFVTKLPERFPVIDRSKSSRVSTDTDGYWGTAVAIALAKNGLPIGYEKTQEEGEPIVRLRGSQTTINHWLTVAGFEHRYGGKAADSEARSGLFTLLVQPSLDDIYQHTVAAHTGTAIEQVMQTHPRYDDMRQTAAARFEVIDHEGVARLYQEDPEHVLRLFLTRELPHVKHTRKAIETNQRALTWEDYVATKEDDPDIQRMYSPRENRRVRKFQQDEINYWQGKVDFTIGLLQSGYTPYTLAEAVPFVERYVAGLLAEHPELSPTVDKPEIRDVMQDTRQLLRDLHRKDVFDTMRHNPQDN